MTNIDKANVEEEALKLVNEIQDEWGKDFRYRSLGRLGDSISEALCRAIERHEAFKQEVSDAVVDTEEKYGAVIRDNFGHFIIPKSDPLVEVMKQAGWAAAVIDSCAPSLRDALEARGLEIRPKEQ